ncbi:hypothetical protein FOCC_FOCC016262 [Frankliniella occidentalis]|nr:hypothetical protein FOCC_FOCC016262 [Frankliniella occidentalis]
MGEKSRNSSRKRTCTLRYELEEDGVRIIVCKKCFLATLSENDGFVARALANKKESYSGVTRKGRRGRKPSAKKTATNVIACIQDHISSFPKYASHYGRSDSTKQYLGANLSVNQMFKLYIEDKNNFKVSLSTYIREFRKTGLRFKPPAVDTCSKCDGFKQALKHCKSEEDKAQLEEQRKDHHQKAEKAYAAKKEDKAKAAEDPTKQVIMFDLEQVLPCPLLSSGETFYKRQLSVYNLTVYNSSSRTGTNYMWSEVVAGRGANEIASCLTRYIKEEVKQPVSHLVMYSDTCSGQNKNSHVCAAFIATIQDHPSLKVIDHKFLIPGHTFMECDQIHAQIEKKKRRATAELHYPRDWFNFIRTTVPYNNSNLLVREMKQKHFLDFVSLLQLKMNGPLIMRSKNTEKEHFLFSHVQWFQYREESSTVVLYKEDLDCETAFKQINFRRRGKLGINALKTKQCSQQMLPISIEKKNDLLSLLPQVNPIYHQFYQTLPASNRKDYDPDCIPQDVDIAEDLLEEIAD